MVHVCGVNLCIVQSVVCVFGVIHLDFPKEMNIIRISHIFDIIINLYSIFLEPIVLETKMVIYCNIIS